MDHYKQNPICVRNESSYDITDQFGNIIFEFPLNTLLENVVNDLWPIIINYHFCYFPFAIKIMDDNALNPFVRQKSRKPSPKILDSNPKNKYQKEFPELKSKKIIKKNNRNQRIYRPVTCKEVRTESFRRLFKDSCINNMILCPKSNKPVINVIQVNKKNLGISSNVYNTYNSYVYDELSNKMKSGYPNHYRDIVGDFNTTRLYDNSIKADNFEQLLVLSNIRFY